MTLEEAQKEVDRWIKTYGVRYFSELTNMAVLTEEVNMVTNPSRRAKNATLQTRWPMCFGYSSASPTRQV